MAGGGGGRRKEVPGLGLEKQPPMASGLWVGAGAEVVGRGRPRVPQGAGPSEALREVGAASRTCGETASMGRRALMRPEGRGTEREWGTSERGLPRSWDPGV